MTRALSQRVAACAPAAPAACAPASSPAAPPAASSPAAPAAAPAASSDASFVPSDPYSSLPSTAPGIPQSEYDYIMERASEERMALEQRVIERLRQITNLPIDLGKARANEPRSAIQLTPEQTRVHQIATKEGTSIFFTGAAGTGKSILLRRIIEDLRRKKAVAVTASTGIAACAIGGRTVHSWAGVGLGLGEREKLLRTVRRSKGASARWKGTDCLVIDEVSMLSPDLLDNLDFIGQRIRGNKQPFGGIQVILTGDFFQLPPVDKERADRQYAFDAKCWKQLVRRTILLTQVFRQRDATFQNMLNEVRYGQISAETARNFAQLNRAPPHMPQEITPTRLFSRRHEVDRANSASLASLREDPVDFEAEDMLYPPPVYSDALGDAMGDDAQRAQHLQRAQPEIDLSKLTWIAPEKITLKKGAQVMMIKNIDETLVNGSIGRILAWVQEPPLPPALAKNVIDITAMINELHSCSLPKLARFERSLSGEGKRAAGRLPLVRFFNQNGTFRDVILQRETWNFENEFGEVLASRTQIPLILAYALSIHKAQGQTLDYVHVDMRSVFEVGQAYVALSRATHLDGLQLVGFNPSRVKCDPRVVQFYNSLERVSQPLVSDMFRANAEQKHEPEEEEPEEPEEEEPDRTDFFAAFRHKRTQEFDPRPAQRQPKLEGLGAAGEGAAGKGADAAGAADDLPEPPDRDPFARFRDSFGQKMYPIEEIEPSTDYDSDFDGGHNFEERYRRFGRGSAGDRGRS